MQRKYLSQTTARQQQRASFSASRRRPREHLLLFFFLFARVLCTPCDESRTNFPQKLLSSKKREDQKKKHERNSSRLVRLKLTFVSLLPHNNKETHTHTNPRFSSSSSLSSTTTSQQHCVGTERAFDFLSLSLLLSHSLCESAARCWNIHTQ